MSKEKSKTKKAFVVLGNQLFPLEKKFKEHTIFMAESWDLCTYEKHHKQKIVLFLTSMREFRKEHENKEYTFHYCDLEAEKKFEDHFKDFVDKHGIEEVELYEIVDKPFKKSFEKLMKNLDVSVSYHPTPMFLNTKEEFKEYLKAHKSPFMKTFYEKERKKRDILLNKDGSPEGGKWSYDSENRKKLPKDKEDFSHFSVSKSETVKEVEKIVDQHFSKHPGALGPLFFPTKRGDYRRALTHFLKYNLKDFGDFQDAISTKNPFLHHSLISPGLNLGLLTPQEVIDKTCEHYQKNKKDIPLSSVEGFLRQVMGWREFLKGVYDNYSEKEEEKNFFNHKRKLRKCWYTGETGLPPVDDVIKKCLKYGYAHHIERLMILSNTMLLTEVKPKQVHTWFMEMFVDSSEWVMGPNVYGMGQFSDGGIFATKPYVSGSNYILKMTNSYKKGDWCDIWDGLYWRFIDKHQDYYKSNQRMGYAVSTLNRMNSDKKERIFKAAKEFIQDTTYE